MQSLLLEQATQEPLARSQRGEPGTEAHCESALQAAHSLLARLQRAAPAAVQWLSFKHCPQVRSVVLQDGVGALQVLSSRH